MLETDTIAAIATAMAPSGIGIIRVSGEEAFDIADRIFVPYKGHTKVCDMKTHTIHYGYIKDGDQTIDEVLLMVMRAPHTYTRENTIEIDTHGGVLVMQKIMETVIKYGARPAEPGEYTKRAFLNGRIDLTEAESVMDIINAQNENALKCSVSQLQGSLYRKIRSIREKILHETAFIESALDDPEHYTLDGYLPKLKTIMTQVSGDLQDLLDKSNDGRMIKEGINTAIIGKPNAGKSSLLNVLIGEDRAIVTDIAGTTRDTLQEQIQIKGIGLNIIDTAGIRSTDDVVEKIGVQKSKEAMDAADLIIYVADSSTDLDENDEQIISSIQDKKAIVLLNKSDLPSRTTAETLRQKLDKPVIAVSMKDHSGIDELEQLIQKMFFHGSLSFNDEVYISNIRQKKSLQEALESVRQVLHSIDMQMPEDFFTIDMMDAYGHLGQIIGESVDDDLADEIFSKFCMGK